MKSISIKFTQEFSSTLILYIDSKRNSLLFRKRLLEDIVIITYMNGRFGLIARGVKSP